MKDDAREKQLDAACRALMRELARRRSKIAWDRHLEEVMEQARAALLCNETSANVEPLPLVPKADYDAAIEERDRFDDEAERLGVERAEAWADYDTALARIKELEADLADERNDARQDEQYIVKLKARIAELEAELERKEQPK